MAAARKTLAWLFLCTYLVLGVGGEHAFIWCQDATGQSRVEFNLAGRCDSGCGEDAVAPQVASQSFQPEASDADCNDQKTAQQLVRPRGFDSGFDLPALGASFPSFSPSSLPAQTLVPLRLAPQPPPSQMLAALRTIVLLI